MRPTADQRLLNFAGTLSFGAHWGHMTTRDARNSWEVLRSQRAGQSANSYTCSGQRCPGTRPGLQADSTVVYAADQRAS